MGDTPSPRWRIRQGFRLLEIGSVETFAEAIIDLTQLRRGWVIGVQARVGGAHAAHGRAQGEGAGSHLHRDCNTVSIERSAALRFAGSIAKCGVLAPGAPLSIEQLYARYRARGRTIRELLADPASNRTLEENWIARYCTATPIKFVGVWDTVGSLGNPLTSMRQKVSQYRFLDTHLYVHNEFAFHALALDEQRRAFEPTFWTRTVSNNSNQPARPIEQVEQRWFVGAHANVGGGYPSDILAQPPLKWLMTKAASLGQKFRFDLTTDGPNPTAPVADSYMQFGPAVLRPFSKRFYRPVGLGPVVGTKWTSSRINETIDAGVFERWRLNPEYRPRNLLDWAQRKSVDPASFAGTVLATDPQIRIEP